MKTLYLTLLIGISCFTAYAQSAGQLDYTFNSTGFHSLSPGIMHDNLNAVGVQSDQKIIGFGMTMSEGTFNFDLCLVRLKPNGAIDSTFATDGYFKYDHAGESDFIYDGVILPDDKILACGAVSNSADDTEIMLLRLNSDGTLDNTFGGGDGMAIHTINTGQDYANSLVVLSDGSIMIVGSTAAPGMLTTRGLIMKFDELGEVDENYGFNGYSILAYGTDSDIFKSMVVMPDGGLMVVGYSSINFSNVGWVCKVDAEGALDSTFGTSGHYIYDSGIAAFSDIEYYGTRYVVCGNRFFGSEDAVLIALEADGSLSTSFGTNGEAVIDIDEADATNKLFIDDQGGLIVAGSAGPSFFERNALVFRLDADGVLDPNFGQSGIFNLSFANNFDVLFGVAEQADSKLILGGLASENDNNILFIRINGAGTVSIDEPNAHSALVLYPQPTNETLRIESANPINTVAIYSSTGQLILNENVYQVRHSLNTSTWPDGVYTIQVKFANGDHEAKRIIVSHR
jgi:uncharacterized delta-60 repeat protein